MVEERPVACPACGVALAANDIAVLLKERRIVLDRPTDNNIAKADVGGGEDGHAGTGFLGEAN